MFFRLGRVALGLALISTAATAATFTVVPYVLTPDEHDANPGDGIAVSENGNVTFRAAIEEANALPGKDTIVLQQSPAPAEFIPRVVLQGGEVEVSDDLYIVGQGPFEDANDLTVIEWQSGVNTITVRSGVRLEISELEFDASPEEDDAYVFVIEEDAVLEAFPLALNSRNWGTIIRSDRTAVANFGGTVNLDRSGIATHLFDPNSGPSAVNIGGTYRLIRSAITGGNNSFDGGTLFSNGGSIHLETTRISNGNASRGAGIFAVDTDIFAGNSTFALNESIQEGGGLYVEGGTLTLVNCTISDNAANISSKGDSGGGGGLFVGEDVSVNIGNTIVSGNSDGSGIAPDVRGEVSSLGHNLVGIVGTASGFGTEGDLVGNAAKPIDARLEPFDRSLSAFPLLEDSPAINAGDNAMLAAGLFFDEAILKDVRDSFAPQRFDFFRFQGPSVDIGSYELQPHFSIHTADQNADSVINLTEVLRVIQFYNSGGYSCAEDFASTEDGYIPGPDGTIFCAPHDLEFDVFDWAINLTELLRAIQFYNASGYGWCPASDTEDGYCPVNTF